MVIYLLYNIFKYKNLLMKDFRIICLTISMIGLLMAQISNVALINCNSLVWGLLYCVIEDIKHKKF